MTTAPQAPVCATPRCARPAVQLLVCWACLDELRADLRAIPELLPELEVTLTRQDVSGGEHMPEPPEEARTKDGPPAATTVMPFRGRPSEVGRYLHEVLETWTRHLLAALCISESDAGLRHPRSNRPGPRTLELAAWLERHPDTIGTNPDAGALVDNIRWTVEDVRRVIWPIQLSFYGLCSCGCALYAARDTKSVRCRDCDRGWRVDELTRWWRGQAEGALLSAEDMSRALPRLAADISIPPLTASQIRGYGARGRLAQHRPDPRTWTVGPDGEPVPPPPRYKVAEVIELMQQLWAEEQTRQERRNRSQSASVQARVLAAHQRLKEALRA